MESKSELSKKYLELKKLIEKKEKKLKKVNRALGAKEHVKRKLKECNKPTEDSQISQQSHGICPVAAKPKSSHTCTILSENQETTDSTFEKSKCTATKTLELAEGLAIYPHSHAKNDLPEVLPVNICSDTNQDNKKSENKTFAAGECEESPILITDSQPKLVCDFNSEESQHSKNGLKKRLSLKRKRNQYNSCTKDSVLRPSRDNGKGTNNNLVQVGETSEVQPLEEVTDSDSISFLKDQLSYSVQQNQEKDNYKKVLEDSSQITCELEHDKKKVSQEDACSSQAKLVETQLCAISQDIVLQCTPDVTSSDLNKAFVFHNHETLLSSLNSSQTSSQDIVSGSSAEIVRTKRRGRPPKLKQGRTKQQVRVEEVNQYPTYTADEQLVHLKSPAGVSNSAQIRHQGSTVVNFSSMKVNNNLNVSSLEKETQFEIQSSCMASENLLQIGKEIQLSSQNSTVPIKSKGSDSCSTKRKRGRPPKPKNTTDVHRIRGIDALNEVGNTSRRIDNIPECNTETDSQISMSQEFTDISGSQELFDQTSQEKTLEFQNNHDSDEFHTITGKNESFQFESLTLLGTVSPKKDSSCLTLYDKAKSSEKREKIMIQKKMQYSGIKAQNVSEKESLELSTLILIQESFIEKKEYSTRRKSTTGSPFMISSIFQFIIDESKRCKEFREFQLPDRPYSRYIVRKMEVSDSCTDLEENDNKYRPKNGIVVSGESQHSLIEQNIDDSSKTIKVLNEDKIVGLQLLPSEKQFVDSLQLKAVDKSNVEKVSLKSTKTEGFYNEFSCGSQNTGSFPLDDLALPRLNESQCSDNLEDLETFTSSQSLFTPSGKERCGSTAVSSEDSQMDSMGSNSGTGNHTNESSLQLPEGEHLVSICTSCHIFRKKEVQVLGCLSTRSLSVLKYKNRFSLVHKWDFQHNHSTETVHGFSLEGKAFFISIAKTEENLLGIYVSYYSNKRDNFMFKVTDIQSSSVKTSYISNRVLGIACNKGETIHVWKYVLHNNLKCLASSDQLDSTEGQIQDILAVDNLPSSVAVCTFLGEFCLWNHENKRLLFRVKPDYISRETRLLGVAWEQGYFFLQLFFTTEDKYTSGVHAVFNPSTMMSSTISTFKSGTWNGYSTHCTVKDHIITVDKDYQVCVWDRYSSEFLSRTRQIHAIGIAVLEDHIAVGGRQCVHIH